MITIEKIGKFVRVVLKGDKRNAFTPGLIEELSKINCDEDVVITNMGPVFSAGLDLSVFLEGKEAVLEYLFKVHGLVKKFLQCGGRTVAYINGDVYGFGVEFLYFLDYVVASRGDIKLSLQGVNFGVFPPYTVAIGSRIMTPFHLKTLISRPVTAQEALYMGIVSEIGQLDLGKLFTPPQHVFRLITPRNLLLGLVDEAVPFFYKLAEISTFEETRRRIRQFIQR